MGQSPSSHIGAFDWSEQEHLELLRLGLRFGCEFLDVECTLNENTINTLASERHGTLLVGSYVEADRMPDCQELESIFRRCLLNGAASFTKVLVKGSSSEDAIAVQKAGASVTPSDVGFTGICLGCSPPR